MSPLADSAGPAADRYIEHLEDLIRWLALPYGEGRPIFATELPDGRPLDAGLQNERLYFEIIGERPLRTTGAWWRCGTCAMWQVRNDIIDALPPSPAAVEYVEQVRRLKDPGRAANRGVF